MKPEIKSRIQIFLIVMLVLAGARVAYIFHERHAAAPPRKAEDEGRSLTSDEYVVAKKFTRTILPRRRLWSESRFG